MYFINGSIFYKEFALLKIYIYFRNFELKGHTDGHDHFFLFDSIDNSIAKNPTRLWCSSELFMLELMIW